MEIAFISANKLEVELAGKKRGWAGRVLQNFKTRSSHFLGTALLGNNIALVFFGLLFTALVEPWFLNILPESLKGDFSILLLSTIVSTIIILFAGEFIPKNLFRSNPVGKLSVGIPIFWFMYWLLRLPVIVIVALSKWMLGAEEQEEFEERGLSRVDLQHYISRMKENVSAEKEETTDIFTKTLELNNIKARECMVPRNEIEAFDENADLEEIKKRFIESKFSKLVVYKDNIDQPVGYLHHLDLLKGKTKPKVHKLTIFPEAKPARDILQILIKKRRSMALVVDEFGGTSGIVTVEDIIEEIFGEIEDEHDEENAGLLKQKISDNEFLLSGRLEIDLLNEEFELGLPEDGDFETLAGFIIEQHESIPEKDEVIEIDNFKFVIVEATQAKIETVRMFADRDD